MSDLRNMPESYWKEKLTPEQYKVVRQKGTERAFTGKYVAHCHTLAHEDHAMMFGWQIDP